MSASSTTSVSTTDKIIGSIKENVGSFIGDKDMKEEGKAVHKLEKNEEKIAEGQEKLAKKNDEVDKYEAKAGVDAEHITTGDRLLGSIKKHVGSAIGNKDMKEEGKAVEKAEEAQHKLEKQRDKLAEEHNKAGENRDKAGL
eukprot:TRINITY_DN118_c0_g1_i1.p1 TRINITY_DN118_c0_g1~~TRINITY_DN118_c0_g1_i1.p1  ORF type:complete len:141 (-),score=60.96 TRINITY_DN118_c0_g1_i1:65-487(-)